MRASVVFPRPQQLRKLISIVSAYLSVGIRRDLRGELTIRHLNASPGPADAALLLTRDRPNFHFLGF